MRTRFPLFWLALHRRRRMLAFLAAGMVVFEALIVTVARAVPPTQLFAGTGPTGPDALKAFSGSPAASPSPATPDCSEPVWCTRSGPPCN